MKSNDLSEKELERYDRQIRVWGAEAQSRIQNSHILVIGAENLHIEVLKNLILAGVNVTIQDTKLVSINDLSYNFLLDENDIGLNRAEAILPKAIDLNNYAKVNVVTKNLEDLEDEYFYQYNIILATDLTDDQVIRIDTICRKSSPHIVFIFSDTFGFEGIFFSDFGDDFQYKQDQPASNLNQNPSVDSKKNQILTITFPSLQNVFQQEWRSIPMRFFPLSPTFVKARLLQKFRALNGFRNPCEGDEEKVEEMLQQFEKEQNVCLLDSSTNESSDYMFDKNEIKRFCIAASAKNIVVFSVLGSFLSQEVIKAISHTGAPAFNVFTFNENSYEAKSFPIKGALA